MFKALLVSVLCAAGAAQAASPVAPSSAWNAASDPYAGYGLCLQGSIGSGLASKALEVLEAGGSLTGVLSITVLQCGPFGGGGGAVKVPCPAGSPYAYCVHNSNDGEGNQVLLGVLALDAGTDPNGLYTGCPEGATLASKLGLVQADGRDPRTVKGIVTLACSAAAVRTAQPPHPVACPQRPVPYGYCLATDNDGAGNAVTLGVVTVTGTGDAYGLYGQCNTTLSAYGIAPGFLPKSSLLTALGRSLDTVRSIDVIQCNAPSGFGPGFPPVLTVMSCQQALYNKAAYVDLARRYAYCVIGTDAKGNGVIAGVNFQ